ncbi:MAG: hypothetical protein ABR975_06810 [Vulcanimicrobiaceae bacterium]
MIERIRVVFPTPLRPSTAVTAPAGGDDPAVVQQRQPVDHVEHDPHVVLDHDHGEIARLALEHVGHQLRVAGREARRRLVEQQQTRLLRDREQDLDLAFLTVAERVDHRLGASGQPDALEQRPRFVVARGASATRHHELEPVGRGRLQSEREVLDDAELRKERRGLKRARETESRALVCPQPGHVASEQPYLTGGTRQFAGDDVEEGRLSGAVGPEDAAPLAVRDRERDVLQDAQAAEALGDAPQFEADVLARVGHEVGSNGAGAKCRPWSRAARRRPSPTKPSGAQMTMTK